MPRFSLLPDWLAWLETLHPKAIDLGLSRIYQVATILKLLHVSSAISHDYSGALAIDNGRVFTVAGTNGKGSCVSTLEQTLLAQGYKVGSYTSPHLHHYCERIRIDGKPVAESIVCEAFAAIDHARGDISLTYFEFGTLAALWIFVQQQVPYVVLEVGLGGRLDAVNIVDADIAIVTSIAVDHEEWLGSDREVIALEKLGVTRKYKPTIITEQHLTQSLSAFIRDKKIEKEEVSVIDQDFSAVSLAGGLWQWHVESAIDAVPDHDKPDMMRPLKLPLPALPLNSVVAGLQALHICQLLPCSAEQRSILLEPVLQNLSLSGRYQRCDYRSRKIIFDVAHNPAAAQVLSERLQADSPINSGKTLAVFAVMNDKDIHSIISPFANQIDKWFVGDVVMNARAMTAAVLADVLQDNQHHSDSLGTIEQAFDAAVSESNEHDRIVVFGSFFTVAAIQAHINT